MHGQIYRLFAKTLSLNLNLYFILKSKRLKQLRKMGATLFYVMYLALTCLNLLVVVRKLVSAHKLSFSIHTSILYMYLSFIFA